MRYLIDSDYLIDALSGIRRAKTTIERLSDQGVAVSIVSLGEVYEGAFGLSDPQSTLDDFRGFLGDFPILPISDPIMVVFARIRARLRTAGQLIPDLDLLIAATAIHHDLTLVTRNLRHFERVPELWIYRAS